VSAGFSNLYGGPRAASAGKPEKACTPVDCDLPFGFPASAASSGLECV
jgi:hypothetical protein